MLMKIILVLLNMEIFKRNLELKGRQSAMVKCLVEVQPLSDTAKMQQWEEWGCPFKCEVQLCQFRLP